MLFGNCNFDRLLQILRKQSAIYIYIFFYTRLLLPEIEHLEFVHKLSMSSSFYCLKALDTWLLLKLLFSINTYLVISDGELLKV